MAAVKDGTIITGHWKLIKQNIDVDKLIEELKKYHVVEKSDIDHIQSIPRSRAINELICIANRNRNKLPNGNLKKIIEANGLFIANSLTTPIQEPKWKIDANTTLYTDLLKQKWQFFEPRFTRSIKENDLLDITDDFVEGFVFDFEILENITRDMSDMEYENVVKIFCYNVQMKIDCGSYQCLIYSLLHPKREPNRNFKDLLTYLRS